MIYIVFSLSSYVYVLQLLIDSIYVLIYSFVTAQS